MDSDIQQTDLLAVMKAGIHEPPETSLRLEQMARTIADEIRRDPEAAAQAFVAVERDRMTKHRQLMHALVTLGERNAALVAHQLALEEVATALHRMEQWSVSARVVRAWRWLWRCS